MPAKTQTTAFTLLEVLIVVGIIALLAAILLPAFRSARQSAQTIACRANLKMLMTGAATYSAANKGAIVPSYNMRGVSASTLNPLDGWAPILDRDRYVRGSDDKGSNPFICPTNMADVAGMSATQTGTDPLKPQGFMDWPAIITTSQNYAATISSLGFRRIIRVGYWINGDNPIGVPREFVQSIHYTGSVGYGPSPSGKTMRLTRSDELPRPFNLIALADGLYAGKQEVTQLGNPDSRIGYRHPGRPDRANLGFADGHVGIVAGDRFPRKWVTGLPLDLIRHENGGNLTIYANPQRDLP